MVTFKSYFMHDPQIPNFYLANLESGPFWTILTGPQGLRGASYQKVAYGQMLMFDGPLQVLFYAWPPNSQLLFSEPENGPFFTIFTGP